jgi:hypothetical protein
MPTRSVTWITFFTIVHTATNGCLFIIYAVFYPSIFCGDSIQYTSIKRCQVILKFSYINSAKSESLIYNRQYIYPALQPIKHFTYLIDIPEGSS